MNNRIVFMAVVGLSIMFCLQQGADFASAEPAERDRFIQANAEITCFSISGNQNQGEEDPYEKIAMNHGFSLEELEALSEKYPGTEREVGIASREQCPDAWGGFQQYYQSAPDEWKQSPEGGKQNLDYWKKQ